MLHRVRTLSGALVALAATSVAALDYAPYETTDLGSWPEAVAIGDLNGDGRNDVVVSTTYYFDTVNDFTLQILYGRADGTLEVTPERVPYGANANRNGLLLLDLDRDGRNEVVVSHGIGLTIARRDPATGVWATQVVAGGAAADNLAVVDVNRDGAPDVAALPWTGPLRIYVNDGAGRFPTAPLQVASVNQGYNGLTSADINGDGAIDVVVQSGQGFGAPIAVHLHDGLSGFLPYTTIALPSGELANGVAVGDLNGDQLPDIAVAGWGNRPVDVYVSTQGLNGAFAPVVPYPSYDIPETMLSADLDGNGLDDLAVLHGGWLAAGRYLQSRLGLAAEALSGLPYSSHYSASGLAAGAVLGNDTCPDLVVADYAGLVTLRGQNCVSADLAVEASIASDTILVTTANAAGDAAAIEPITVVSLTFANARHPAIATPTGCTVTGSTPTSIDYACWSDDLAVGVSRAYAFRGKLKRTAVTVRADTSSPTRDTNTANNVVVYSVRG